MNVLKHMEAVFVATVALAVSGSYLIQTIPEAHAQAAVAASASVAAVPVVTVSAKRMTAEEKAQSLRDEQAVAGQRSKGSRA